jgi:hypothetical protein
MVQIQTTKTNASNPDNENQWFKSRHQKPMVRIQTPKTNGSKSETKQWPKSRQQKPMVQIQTTKTKGSNPDNKNNVSNPENEKQW